MKEIFMSFLNVSINGSILIAAVILTRFIFKRYNRSIICILWGLVALRMLIPVNIPLELSLLPVAESVTAEKVVADVPITDTQPHKAPIIDSGINVGGDKGTPDTDTNSGGDTDTDINVGGNNGAPVTDGGKDGEELPPVSVTPGVSVPVAPPASNTVTSDAVDTDTSLKTEVKDIIVRYGSIVWLVGMACMVIYLTAGDVRLRLKTRVRYEKEKGVFLCDDVKSPFVMGVIRPRIILPSSTDGDNEHYILIHERAHIERGDHIWKVLAFAVLAVHWYNPLVWLSFMLYSRDTEMACDERVLKRNGTEIRKAYAHALLTYSTRRETTGGWSFSQRSLAVRIKGVLNYKKPALWVFVSFALACVVLVVCFMTVPVEGEDGDGNDIHVSATEGTSETESTESTELTENTEMTENTEPTENPEPTEPTENTEPSDTVTEPTEPKPTELEPTEPAPTEPEPTEPAPTEPEPTEPEPTEPEPTEPEPTDPEPTEPEIVYNIVARDTPMAGEGVDYTHSCELVKSFRFAAGPDVEFNVANAPYYDRRSRFLKINVISSYSQYETFVNGFVYWDDLLSESMFENLPKSQSYDEKYFSENIMVVVFFVNSIKSVTKNGSEICVHMDIEPREDTTGYANLDAKNGTKETISCHILEMEKADLEGIDTFGFSLIAVEKNNLEGQ